MSATLIRSAKTIRKLRDTARDALRAVRALEELDQDIFGQYLISPGETLDATDLCEFIRLAQNLYRDQELAVVVIARSPGKDQGDRNGWIEAEVRHP